MNTTYNIVKIARGEYQVFDNNGQKCFVYPVSKHEAQQFIISCKTDERFLNDNRMQKVAMQFINDRKIPESSFGDVRQFMVNSIYKMYHGDIRELMRRRAFYREHLEKVEATNKAARRASTNTIFLHANVSPVAADILLEVDGFKTDLYAFMWTNMAEHNVNHISIEDAERVLALKPGESIFINIVEVKRIN